MKHTYRDFRLDSLLNKSSGNDASSLLLKVLLTYISALKARGAVSFCFAH